MQIDARSRRRHRSFDGTSAGLTDAFDSLGPAGRAVVALTDGGRMLLAQRTARGGWRLRHVGEGTRAGGSTSSRSGVVDETAARAALAAYLEHDPSWASKIGMRRGLASRSPALLIAVTFVVATGLALVVMQLTGTLEGFDTRYLPNLFVGVALIICIVVYIDFFMRTIRPRIATALGVRMGAKIVESDHGGWFSRPGMWETDDGTTLSTLRATVADFVVIVLGLVLPVTAFATAVLLLADRFLP